MSTASNKKLVDIKRKCNLKTGWNETIVTVSEMRKSSKDSNTAIINMFKDLKENEKRNGSHKKESKPTSRVWKNIHL